MSETVLLSAAQSLIATIATELTASGRDLSRCAVVFPGKRPAHFLRKELASRIGTSYIPPRIFSIDDFVAHIHDQTAIKVTADLRPIDAVALLFDAHCSLRERLGGEHFTSFDSFLPIGMKLLRELEELKIAGFSERRLREQLSGLTFNRLFSLPQYYSEFYRTVEDLGYSTRGMRYAEAADRVSSIDLREFDSIMIAGLFRLTAAEQRIVDHLKKLDQVRFFHQEEGVPEDSSLPEISVVRSPDSHGQVFALNALFQDRINRGEALNERSVVVLPTPESLFPLVQQPLSLLNDENYNVALGYPLSRTPMFGFLNSLLELLESEQQGRFSVSRYMAFLLHPYTKNIRFGQRTDVTRVLVHSLQRHLVADRSAAMVNLDLIEQLDEVFTNIAFVSSQGGDDITAEQVKEHLARIHSMTIRSFRDFTSIAFAASKVVDLLTFVYEQSTANVHPLFRPYAEALVDAFSSLQDSIVGAKSFTRSEGYLRFIREFGEMQEVPFAGTPIHGLQVLGLLETRNLQFDDVYVLDANDDVLPGLAGADVLLPQPLRQQLGLETSHDNEKHIEYYFRLLIKGAKRVHLFYTQSGKSERSRFVETLLWEQQKRDQSLESERAISSVRYALDLTQQAVAPIEKSKELVATLKQFVFSASALDTYLSCPIRFYYSHVLKLSEQEEAGEELGSQDVGKFVHEVLSSYFAPTVNRPLAPEDLNPDAIETIAEMLFANRFGSEPVGAAYLLKHQIIRQLRAYVELYQLPLVAHHSVTINELEHQISVTALGSRFTGRIDRIEQRDQQIYILDYKTGGNQKLGLINFDVLNMNDRTTWSKAVSSLQLPLYLLLYSRKHNIGVERIVPAYLLLGKNTISSEIEVPFEEEGSVRAERQKTVETLLEKIVQEVTDAEIPFRPTDDIKSDCPSCPFSVMCGTQWVRGWSPH